MSQAAKRALAEVEAPIVKDVAPPFFGAGFSVYKSGPAAPGFWSAIRHDATRGGLVVQLGANAGEPQGSFDRAFAGFQYEFTTPAASGPRYYLFTAKFNPGPVTVKNETGNYISPYCELRYLTPIGGPVLGTPVSNTPLTLNTARSLQPNTKYKISLGCGVQIVQVFPEPGKLPYGEVIIKDTDLNLNVYSVPVQQTANGKKAKMTLPAEGDLMEKVAVLEPVSSIEEAQQKGLTGIF